MSSRVWVRSGGAIKTIIESFTELRWTRRYTRMGSLNMTVPRKVDGAQYLVGALGDEISVVDDPDSDTPDLTYVIESLTFNRGPGGLGDDQVQLQAVEAGLFHQRICLPPPHDLPLGTGSAHHEIDAADAESAMRELVDVNVGPSAVAARQYPNLTLATNQNRGISRDWKARFEPLAEKLTTWCELSGLGWEVQYDAGANEHVFTVLEGEDNSASVEFSIRLDNVVQQEWEESGADQASLAYVAGQGEGADRAVSEAYDGTAEPTGKDRREIFVDARDLANESDLAARGDEALAERRVEESFTTDIGAGGPFRYRTDWDLGDTVTLRSDSWDITKTKQIVEIENRVLAGRVERALTFGRAPKSLKDRITDTVGGQATARQ